MQLHLLSFCVLAKAVLEDSAVVKNGYSVGKSRPKDMRVFQFITQRTLVFVANFCAFLCQWGGGGDPVIISITW